MSIEVATFPINVFIEVLVLELIEVYFEVAIVLMGCGVDLIDEAIEPPLLPCMDWYVERSKNGPEHVAERLHCIQVYNVPLVDCPIGQQI